MWGGYFNGSPPPANNNPLLSTDFYQGDWRGKTPAPYSLEQGDERASMTARNTTTRLHPSGQLAATFPRFPHLFCYLRSGGALHTTAHTAPASQGGARWWMRSGTTESTLTCTDLPNTAAISRLSGQRHDHSFLPVTAETWRLKLCMRHVFPII